MKRIISAISIIVLLLSLTAGMVGANGGIAPPTVGKTASPTDINVAGSGYDEVTTVTLSLTGAGGTTTTSIPMDIVFSLDNSGSMSSYDPTKQRAVASKSFIDKLNPAQDTAGVVMWHGTSDYSFGLTPNFTLLKSNIDAHVRAYDGTNLNVGLRDAINMLDANPRTGNSAEVIIFLTDGIGSYTPSGSSGSYADLASSKGYVIYSIGLGPASPGPLQDMADATGGKFFTSATAANLDTIFNDIFTQVVESTIPYNVDVVEVTQGYIIDEGSFNPVPSSLNTVGDITTITWNNIGAIADGDPDFSADETVNLYFTAKSNQVGTNLGVDVLGSAKVYYTDKDGNPAGSVDIPQAYINVINPNRPPVAVIGGPYVATEGDHIDFDAGGSSDPDGDPLQFRWDIDGDGIWDTPFSPSPIYDGFTQCDDYSGTISVEVTDGILNDIDSTTVTFENGVPKILELKAKPDSVQCYQTPIEFTGIGKDPGCDEITVVWDFGDSTSESELSGPAVNSVVTHTYADWGDYIVTLTLSDDDGGIISKQIEVSVQDTIAPKITCVEGVNPHGNIVPGKERGKNGKDKPNVNPDGFYQLLAEDNCDPSPEIYIGTEDDPYMFGPFESGIVIKFTEAPGADPDIKKIGSSNGAADAVTWHITLPSEPIVTVVDAYGNETVCDGCLVPPPPM
ncbi:PKD domain-containing protein [Chloroflexota bacterium]